MTDLQSHKVPIFTNINDVPVAPTSNAGGNGSHLIGKYNDLVNAVEGAITATEAKLYQEILGYPASEPTEEWTTISIELYANSSTGNDTTGNGTSGTPYASITKCIEHIAAKKITRKNTVVTFRLTGTFSDKLDFSNITINCTKNANGSAISGNGDILFNLKGATDDLSGNAGFTLNVNSASLVATNKHIIFPRLSRNILLGNLFINDNGTRDSVRIDFYSANIVCDSRFYLGSNIAENLDFIGCHFTNTSNNDYAQVFCNNTPSITFATDYDNGGGRYTTFIGSNNIPFGLYVTNSPVIISEVMFDTFDQAVYFDMQNVDLMSQVSLVQGCTFNNILTDDIYISDQKVKLAAPQISYNTYNKGIKNQNRRKTLDFYFPTIANGTDYILILETPNIANSFESSDYSIEKIITKATTGSFTFNLKKDSDSFTLSSNTIDTNKNIHTVSNNRVLLLGSMLSLANVAGNATGVYISVYIESY